MNVFAALIKVLPQFPLTPTDKFWNSSFLLTTWSQGRLQGKAAVGTRLVYPPLENLEYLY